MGDRSSGWLAWLLRALVVLLACLGIFVTLWWVGGVSRVKARALSPDGSAEAVCRGWLPEPTEYGVWLRRWWQPLGTYLAHTGTESMGRCREVVWSPDGRLVVVVNEGNALVFLDANAHRQLAVHDRLAPGETWDYASERIITSLRFTSDDGLEFEHCDRQPALPGSGGDFSRCGADVRRARARLVRSPSGMSLAVTDRVEDAR